MKHLPTCAAMLLSAIALAANAAESTAATPVETVVVVGVAPLPDQALPLELIPANVQVFSSAELDRLQALDLTQYMNRASGSVFINEAQNNPLQPDVQFRGFTASPLLGLPQGIAVYQDGVRINEAFGDTVNWALVPEFAISRLAVMPGSNPVFGMNALGGALTVQTKNGLTHPGKRAEVRGGAFSRTAAEAEFGASSDERLAFFVGGSYFDEDGWRDFSPSRARQVFADVRYAGAASTTGLSLTHVSTDLVGNGPSPVQLLEADREAIFTRPDRTRNDLLMLNLSVNYRLGTAASLSGVVYRRRSDIGTLNGDDSTFEECEDEPGVLCEEDGAQVLDANGDEIEFAPDVSGATLNRSSTGQETYGTSWQLMTTQAWADRKNHWVAGVSFDRSQVDFESSTELGSLDGTRNALPGGIFVQEAFTGLHTTTRSYGVYLTDTLELTSTLAVNLAGRYGVIEVNLDDRLGTELEGDHRFSRFNPAAGITYRPASAVQFYASIGEASRAPSPAELTCADEGDPCRLPNAFLSDPPLEPVVSRTLEAGARGDLSFAHWHLGAFRSVNRDDILFISAGALTNEGFFENVGRTRRQGLELSLNGTLAAPKLAWSASYALVDATFQENFSVASGNNPAAVDAEIEVESGDRIPSVPRHLLKASLDYSIGPRWSVGADWSHASGQYLRGDEGNRVAPVSGYSILNLRATFKLSDHFSCFALIDNALDEEYETFGVFGEADDVLGAEYQDTRFLSPGAPRAAWVGVRLAL
jgi:outer membrane receptor protein involved in Fe transport